MSFAELSQPSAGSMTPKSFAISHQRPRASFVGCSKIHDYELLGKLGEGTFGEVHRAKSKKTGALVALKRILLHNEKDGFPITALREIKLLKLLSHENVLKLADMAVEHPPRRTDKKQRPIMYMVMPYMDHDLSGLLDNPSVRLQEAWIKCYMLQLLQGLKYLHENHILHRDMKAANLLINNKGILQIADFGLARHYDGPTPVAGRGGGEARRDYTSLVVTRWYRPPELLMHLKSYTTAIDIWGVGCVFGEMLLGKPILAGESDSHQLDLIFDLCGNPTEDNMPGWKQLPGASALNPRVRPGNLSHRFASFGGGAISLLKELMKLDWRARTNAIDALEHPYFKTTPLPARPQDIPSFEESHELDRRKFNDRKAALPPAPKGGTVGRRPQEGAGGPNAGFNSADFDMRNGINGRYPNERRNGPAQGDDRRVPAWHRDRGLPPRPPPPVDYSNGWEGAGDHPDAYRDRDRERDRERDRLPRSRGGGGAGGGGGGGGGNRADIDTYIPSYEREGGMRREGREDWRRRDERDDRRHDWRRGEYDDRAGGVRGRTRSRSRSPIRERERDRDVYRR